MRCASATASDALTCAILCIGETGDKALPETDPRAGFEDMDLAVPVNSFIPALSAWTQGDFCRPERKSCRFWRKPRSPLKRKNRSAKGAAVHQVFCSLSPATNRNHFAVYIPRETLANLSSFEMSA